MATSRFHRAAAAVTLAASLGAPAVARAQATDATNAGVGPPLPPEPWAIHAQSTDIFQYHPAFASAFQGPQSFDHGNHTGNTFDATLYLGVRLARGLELWVDPEMNQGIAPNATTGLAGYVNGDGSKIGKAHPYTRFQRVFVRETVDLGGEEERIDPDQNVLGGARTHDHLVFTLGKYNVTDIFDTNIYAHDPRNDFLNWSIIAAGSYDYAADAWGYTYGATAEWYTGPWQLRLGLFDLSDVPNSEHLTSDLSQFQVDAEVEHDHTLGGHPGAMRATLFVSRGNMGDYRDAVAYAEPLGIRPDTGLVRRYRSRPGGSLNLEQEVVKNVGVFARAGWDDGTLESYEYTDIDRTVSGGVQLKGALWGRDHDALGLAGAVNDVALPHAEYLAAGGLGILIGDGALPKKDTERVLEGWYKFGLPHGFALTVDTQLFDNPAYNTERGPVAVFGLRLHAQR